MICWGRHAFPLEPWQVFWDQREPFWGTPWYNLESHNFWDIWVLELDCSGSTVWSYRSCSGKGLHKTILGSIIYCLEIGRCWLEIWAVDQMDLIELSFVRTTTLSKISNHAWLHSVYSILVDGRVASSCAAHVECDQIEILFYCYGCATALQSFFGPQVAIHRQDCFGTVYMLRRHMIILCIC